jgi:hypothetical protein
MEAKSAANTAAPIAGSREILITSCTPEKYRAMIRLGQL